MIKNKLLLFSVGVLSLAVLFTASAVLGQSRNGTWVPPSQQFPQGNTTPPLDVGIEPQVKVGDLDAKTLESTVSESGAVGFRLKPETRVVSGGGSLMLSGPGGSAYLTSASHFAFNTANGSIMFLAPAGQANFSVTKGIVLPNYSTTILGNSVPVGTITYNNGDLWLFTGGTNCQQQQGEGGAFIPSANAQAGRCWVKVGGGTIINNYASSTGPSVWLPGRGGIYTSSTKASIGQTNGTNLEMVVSANGVILQVVTPGGINKGPINKAEAQSTAVAFNITNAGAVTAPATFTAGNTLIAQNTVIAQGVNGISVTPPNIPSYAIKNNSGTLGLYPGNAQNAIFSVGQDGAVVVKDRVGYQGSQMEIVGTSGNESVLRIGGVYNGVSRQGVLKILHPDGIDNHGVAMKVDVGGRLDLSVPGNSNALRLNINQLLDSSCLNVNGVDPHKYLRMWGDGSIVCEKLPDPYTEIIPAPGSDPVADTTVNLGTNWAICSLSWMESTGGPAGAPFRPTGCEVSKNSNGMWYLRAIRNGEWSARCKAVCMRMSVQ